MTSKPATIELCESRCLLAGGMVADLGTTNARFSGQNQSFAIEFDVTPASGQANTAIGLSLGSASQRTSFGPMVRFAPTGTIDARNGSANTADHVVKYVSGQTYRITMVVDVPRHRYSVYVAPFGSAGVTLAANYVFRSEQAGVMSLNNLGTNTISGGAAVRDLNLSNSRSTPRTALPPPTKLYQGAFPGGSDTWEGDITPQQVSDYESASGQHVAWVQFSDNWFDHASRAFPTGTSTWIRDHGSVPYIRLETRSNKARPVTGADPLFTLQAIIDGKFDADITAWAHGAKAFGSPVIAEWGTECNGDWFQWNGRWNGGSETTGFGDPTAADGPERFVAAYRHIVTLARNAGAWNVTWVWHVNWQDGPQENWNRLENYYPGADVVDWIGVSAYGPQRPTQNYSGGTFRQQMDGVYARIQAIAPEKPVIMSEFGAAVNNGAVSAQTYAGDALTGLLSHQWQSVIGFSWWNERWQNDTDPAWNLTVDTSMRLQDTPSLAQVFKDRFTKYNSILGRWPKAGPVMA